MKKFVIAVFGLLLFLVLVNHSPPVPFETNVVRFEYPGEVFTAINNSSIELRAPEVVINDPSLEMDVVLIEEVPEIDISLESEQVFMLEIYGLNQRVLLLNVDNIRYYKNSFYSSMSEFETEVLSIIRAGNRRVLSLFENEPTA